MLVNNALQGIKTGTGMVIRDHSHNFKTGFTKKSKYNVTMYNVKKNNFKQAFSSKNYFNIKVQDLNFKGNDNKINNLTLDSSSTVAA